MKDQIAKIKENAKAEIENAKNLQDLNDVRVKYLGKKGELTAVLRGMGGLSAEERPVIGALVNEVRDFIENTISEDEKKLKSEALKEKMLARGIKEEDIAKYDLAEWIGGFESEEENVKNVVHDGL